MNRNATILYSIHLIDEEEEEGYVIDMDELFDNESNINKELGKLLDACSVSVKQEVIDDIMDFSLHYEAFV